MRRSLSMRGFTLLAVLFVIAAMGIGAGVAMEVWATTAQRERETQLLFVGREFRDALKRYHDMGRQYPATMEELLKDPRSATLRRHLRRVYPDPITGKADWGLLILNERIVGIHSISEKRPLKVDGFELTEERFKDTEKYAQWWFTYPHDLKAIGIHTRRYAPDNAGGTAS